VLNEGKNVSSGGVPVLPMSSLLPVCHLEPDRKHVRNIENLVVTRAGIEPATL